MAKNFKTALKTEKILAIETSSKVFSVALAETDGTDCLKGEIFLDIGMRHSEVLKDACVTLLDQCKWKKEDLTAVAVSLGPGSFTGLRVGISFARALCQNLKIPLVGVSTFEVLQYAWNRSFQNFPCQDLRKSVIAVLVDSVSDEIFSGLFKPGKLRPIEPYRNYSLLKLFNKLDGFSKIWVLGDGFLRYQTQIKMKLKKRFIPVTGEYNFPKARYLALLALEKLNRSGKNFYSWKKIFPYYLRPPLAVERLRGLS